MSYPKLLHKGQELHPIFNFPYDFDRFRDGFLEAYIAKAQKQARFAPFINPLIQLPSLLLQPDQCRSLSFLGTRFKGLIISLMEQNPCVIATAGDLPFVLRHRLPFINAHHAHRDIYALWQRDPKLHSPLAARLINQSVKAFNQTGSNLLIVENDSLFRQRFMVYCAREAGIKSLCIQDGLFQSTTPAETWHGHYADWMGVWGQQTLSQFVAAGYEQSKMCILGYPHLIPTLEPVRKHVKEVCIFGQDWENYSPKLGLLKKKIFTEIADHLSAAGYTIFYKPHPKETSYTFQAAQTQRFRGSMEQALHRFDAFLSLSSTALLDASLAGKLAVQIHHPAFSADHFDKTGYSYSIAHSQMTDLPDLLNSYHNNPWKISSELIQLQPSLKDRFQKLMETL